MVAWIISNWVAVLSIVSMVLGVGVAIAHLLHKDSVASQIQKVEDGLNQFISGNNQK